jgi:hypothetical protein
MYIEFAVDADVARFHQRRPAALAASHPRVLPGHRAPGALPGRYAPGAYNILIESHLDDDSSLVSA